MSFSRGNPDPGIEPRSPALRADSLLFELLGKKWLWRGGGVGEGCRKKWLWRMRDGAGKREVFSIEAWSHKAGALSSGSPVAPLDSSIASQSSRCLPIYWI